MFVGCGGVVGVTVRVMGFVRDEDLEWGPEWVERAIQEDMFESVDPMPPLGVGRVVPEGYFERFGGVFPESGFVYLEAFRV